MKRFKNVFVGVSTDFSKLSNVDFTLKENVKALIGTIFVNEENGNVLLLSKINNNKLWVRIDNTAAVGYGS